VQVSFFDPGVLGNLGFGTNGPDYRVRGIETSLVAAITRGLTAQGAASWNSSTQTNSPFLIANNPALLTNAATAGEFGKPILSVVNPYGPPVVRAPTHHRFSSTCACGTSGACIPIIPSRRRASRIPRTHTRNPARIGSVLGRRREHHLAEFENPPYTTLDASIGTAKDSWTAELYAQNLTNQLKSVFTSTNQFVPAETILRPRVWQSGSATSSEPRRCAADAGRMRYDRAMRSSKRAWGSAALLLLPSAWGAEPATEAPSGAAPSPQVAVLNGNQIIQILDQTVQWYRTLGAQQQSSSQPSDLLIYYANQQTASQVVALAFDIARRTRNCSAAKRAPNLPPPITRPPRRHRMRCSATQGAATIHSDRNDCRRRRHCRASGQALRVQGDSI